MLLQVSPFTRRMPPTHGLRHPWALPPSRASNARLLTVQVHEQHHHPEAPRAVQAPAGEAAGGRAAAGVGARHGACAGRSRQLDETTQFQALAVCSGVVMSIWITLWINCLHSLCAGPGGAAHIRARLGPLECLRELSGWWGVYRAYAPPYVQKTGLETLMGPPGDGFGSKARFNTVYTDTQLVSQILGR